MTEHHAANRAHWNAKSAGYQERHDPQIGRQPMLWGGWSVPEAELDVLGDLTELRILELGCGAAQWARSIAGDDRFVIGLDLSEAQLAGARQHTQDLPTGPRERRSAPLHVRSLRPRGRGSRRDQTSRRRNQFVLRL